MEASRPGGEISLKEPVEESKIDEDARQVGDGEKAVSGGIVCCGSESRCVEEEEEVRKIERWRDESRI